MSNGIPITIDGHPVEVAPGQSVLDAARKLGIEIPTLCYLEKCGPLTSCLVCLVKINGRLVPSCGTKVEPGMTVESETTEVHEARRTAIELLFSDHVGDCLSPCNRLCPLRLDIPVMIRHIQGGRLLEATRTVRDALPLASVLGRLCHHPCEQGCRRAAWDASAGIREMERFIADWDLGVSGKVRRTDYAVSAPAVDSPACRLSPGGPPSNVADATPSLPPRKALSGKAVVIVGAGPAGLTAAYHLLRQGHACTIADRNPSAGGTLRAVHSKALPPQVLSAEVEQLKRLGAVFKLAATLGHDITLDGLLRGFDAVLLAVGETSKAEGEALGVQTVPGGIKIDSETFQTSRPGVFAAGRCVKPFPQLVRAMAEGLAAAECIDAFLQGATPARSGKRFSSMMGRLQEKELETFVSTASPVPSVAACDACAGYTPDEAATEAARCLHCDCRSVGKCSLEEYAEAYGADPTRFRQERKRFEQYVQPCGVIFEPGKCILCGICVKLAEMAAEPLGLTFVGRGFDVRVSAPFTYTIEEGLQRVAAECVEHCPTGALEFRERAVPQPAGS